MKFLVFPCLKKDEESGYDGQVITLACSSNISFVLFFPVSEENAQMINNVLEMKPDTIDKDSKTFGIYKTMLESWTAGDRYLSGIYMDIDWDIKNSEYEIVVKFMISDSQGSIDSVVSSNFVNAIIIAAMERKEIIVSDAMLAKLLPDDDDDGGEDDDEDDDDGEDDDFPSDKDILDTARDIMSGRIKD